MGSPRKNCLECYLFETNLIIESCPRRLCDSREAMPPQCVNALPFHTDTENVLADLLKRMRQSEHATSGPPTPSCRSLPENPQISEYGGPVSSRLSELRSRKTLAERQLSAGSLAAPSALQLNLVPKPDPLSHIRV